MSKFETRKYGTQLEFRATPDGDGVGVIEGRAITFNSQSKDLGFRENIKETAVTDDMLVDVVATYNHDDNFILGRTSNGTLRLDKRSDGVYASIDLPNTTWGRDVAELGKRGDLGGFSFEFSMRDGGEDVWEERNGEWHRDIHKFGGIRAVNPVVDPAYSSSEITSARSLKDNKNVEVLNKMKAEEERKREEFLTQLEVDLVTI